MYIFIGWVDKTANLIHNSINISDELQERVNSAEFTLAWFSPSYFDDVKIWEGFPILSATSTSVTLKKDYWKAIQNNIFRVGDSVSIAINLSDAGTGTGSAISEDSNNIKLTFWTAFTNTPVADELAWRKRFAGNITDIRDANSVVLQNISFQITALDYTRIFDKKLLNDTYEDRDALYMINDFCNVTINKNQTLDQFDYADTTALRAAWTETMQRIADSLAWYWFIDYNRYIWLFPRTTINAPIIINETSNNFSNLAISYDTSRLVNRQVVRGSEETSSAFYSQVIEGNSIAREWIMKNKFKNLTVKLNDGSSTDTMEATTTTTTIKATAHGLVVGDYIVNRTRSNAVREVLTVPDVDTFTVAAVTWQVSTDTFSLFVAQNVWIEGIDVEASFDYMSNFNEKSIRSSETETTLVAGYFLLFTYNEVVPILVQRTDNVSVANMKSILGYTDGIFDGQPITDQTITSRSEATQKAQAVISKYSNVVITATFTTNQEGLEAGQFIRVKDTTSSLRNIDQDFVIQSVKLRQIAWGENTYQVTCSSLLFWMLELLQQILANNRKIKVGEDEVINNIEDSNETMTIADALSTDIDGETTAETITLGSDLTSFIIEPPFYWWPLLWDWNLLQEDWFFILLENGDVLSVVSPAAFTWQESVWD